LTVTLSIVTASSKSRSVLSPDNSPENQSGAVPAKSGNQPVNDVDGDSRKYLREKDGNGAA